MKSIVSDQVLFGGTHHELMKDKNLNREGGVCSFLFRKSTMESSRIV